MIAVGDKVVCVGNPRGHRCYKDYPDYYWTEGEIPVKGRIYVVRRLFLFVNELGIAVIGGSVGVLTPFRFETGWHHESFRKLEDVQNENRLKNLKTEPAPA